MQRRVKADGEIIDYELVQTVRSSVEIRVLPDSVRVFAPRSFPLREADRFVRERVGWIREAQGRLDAYRAREEDRFPMTDGMPVPIEGKTYALRLERAAAWRGRVEGNDIVLSGPDLSPDAVRERLRAFLFDRAKERLMERLNHYAPLIGRSPGRVTVREQRTKWGSCSSQGNVNFNWKLIMAPKEALDYVVIHELCHLYEFNHSPKFWARVEKYQPDYAIWRDFLRSGWAHPYN